LRGFSFFEFGLLRFLACTRLGVKTLIASWWSYDSSYFLFFGFIALAQNNYYEVRLGFILLFVFCYVDIIWSNLILL
jgi:NADH:ubiquinone oxidoreductase subunit H